MKKTTIAFICVHNSCRSQIAEALGKKYLGDICQCFSAGTETKPQINQDAVRLMKYPKRTLLFPWGVTLSARFCREK